MRVDNSSVQASERKETEFNSLLSLPRATDLTPTVFRNAQAHLSNASQLSRNEAPARILSKAQRLALNFGHSCVQAQ